MLLPQEKNFFHRVSKFLSKPNIFILNNRWDVSSQEPEKAEQVKQQHIEVDIKFLVEELEVTDEQTAKQRIFFVSGKQMLEQRSKPQLGKRSYTIILVYMIIDHGIIHIQNYIMIKLVLVNGSLSLRNLNQNWHSACPMQFIQNLETIMNMAVNC